MDSEGQNNELHQIHQIATLQNHSIDQLSFIAHQTMDESDAEEVLLTWDDSSDNDNESASKPRYPSTQDRDNSQDDPEHHNPGDDT
jgi:hypothetical protein